MRDGLGKGDCCLVRGEKQLFDAQPNVEKIKSGRGRWFHTALRDKNPLTPSRCAKE